MNAPVEPPGAALVKKLARDDIERHALEAAAQRIEAQAGNKTYKAAWKVAAKIVRSLKPR